MPEIEDSCLVYSSNRSSFSESVRDYISWGYNPHGQMYQDAEGIYFWLMVKYKR